MTFQKAIVLFSSFFGELNDADMLKHSEGRGQITIGYQYLIHL